MTGAQLDPHGLVEPARSIEHRPELSKYSVVGVPKEMQNCEDAPFAIGVPRKSAITAAAILVAAV